MMLCVILQNGKTALHLASGRGHVGVARVLIDAHAYINQTDKVLRMWLFDQCIWVHLLSPLLQSVLLPASDFIFLLWCACSSTCIYTTAGCTCRCCDSLSTSYIITSHSPMHTEWYESTVWSKSKGTHWGSWHSSKRWSWPKFGHHSMRTGMCSFYFCVYWGTVVLLTELKACSARLAR